MPKTINPDGVTYQNLPGPLGEVIACAIFWFTLKAGKNYRVSYSTDLSNWMPALEFTARPADRRHTETVQVGSPVWPKIEEV